MLKYSYFILVCALTAVDIILLLVSLKHRDKKSVKSFALVVMLIIISHVFYGASLVIKQPDIKFFVHEMKFIGVVYFSVSFFVMYMQFFDRQKMLKRKTVILLTIVPTISVLLALTNNFHHFFRAKMYVMENAYGSFVGVESAWFFWIYLAYTYSVFFFVVCIIIRVLLETPKIYRMQLSIMVIAAVATLVINFVSISGVLFTDFGDATLISFTIAAIIQFYGLVLYKPARMIIMARGLAVNETMDPIVAFDFNDIFLDANIVAHDLFKLHEGLSLKNFFANQLGIPETDSDIYETSIELEESVYSVKMKRIRDEDGALTASFVSVSDITEMKQRERELDNTANFDYLTGIANRHSYLRELRRLRDSDLPAAIIHFNIRGIKAINRIRGSEEGDEIIKRFARHLTEAGEKSFCARIGGDEFVLLLKNTTQKEAASIIEETEKSLVDIRFASGLAVKQSNLDNINIIDKLSMDNMYMNKLIENSGTMARRE